MTVFNPPLHMLKGYVLDVHATVDLEYDMVIEEVRVVLITAGGLVQISDAKVGR